MEPGGARASGRGAPDTGRGASALAPPFAEPVADHRVAALRLCCENADDWRAMVELARDVIG